MTLKDPNLLQRRSYLERIKRWMVYLGWVVVMVAKAAFFFLTGCRRLRVERVVVNRAFLLSNGLLVIHWKARRVLWITAQGKWVGGGGNQVMVLAAGGITEFSIRLQGLFSSYRQSFAVTAEAAVVIRTPAVTDVEVPLSGDRLYPVISAGWVSFTPLVGRSLTLWTAPMELNLPSFQTDNCYDTRLLQHP